MSETYPGKIMLFGEHSIACGSKALVIPYKQKFASWEFLTTEQQKTERIQASIQSLGQLITYLETSPELSILFDIQAFKSDLHTGIYFNSTIPQAYGAGSSGALVAAVYKRYYKGIKPDNLRMLKQLFARIESVFHGSSSGIDPLCCHLQQALKIDENGLLTTLPDILKKKPQFPINIFLIDTKLTSSTAPLVAHFKERLHHYSFFKKLQDHYIPANNQAIESFLAGNLEVFNRQTAILSSMQQEEFAWMIPADFRAYFGPTTTEKPFTLKLCGSGGGGYLLGFTENKSATITYLENAKLSFHFPEF
ncbi:MAG: hypothetical protein KJ578_05040 [Bacteroidetes bacterium]|nr:hypothetical protein [Bacteroidota bacterium]MBU1580529.1 hypothetical protein [Bacteroidota bacterium]MBU2557129.1 hypothetical protein [Bacteroidota bacterium]